MNIIHILVNKTYNEFLFSTQCSEDRIAKEKRFISHQIVEACTSSNASMNLKEGIRMTVNLSFGIIGTILRSKAVTLADQRKDQETQR